MRDDDQVFIFTKAELGLIKATFADNDELIYAIRKVFLQFPLTDAERKLIKAQVTPEVLAVLRKRILPEWTEWYPLTQIPDFFSTLTSEIEKRGVEDMAPMFAAKQLEEDYLKQQFGVLESGDFNVAAPIELIKLRKLEGKPPYQQYVDTTARNYLLGYIDPMLGHIKILAGTKEETPEQQEKRLTRDSAK
jgi:hypothetical protein